MIGVREGVGEGRGDGVALERVEGAELRGELVKDERRDPTTRAETPHPIAPNRRALPNFSLRMLSGYCIMVSPSRTVTKGVRAKEWKVRRRKRE